MAIATDTTPNAFPNPSYTNEGTASYGPERVVENTSFEHESIRAEIDSILQPNIEDFLSDDVQREALQTAIFEAKPTKEEAVNVFRTIAEVREFASGVGNRLSFERDRAEQNQDPDFIGPLRKKVNNWSS